MEPTQLQEYLDYIASQKAIKKAAAKKQKLIKVMNSFGFDWICDIDYINGCEFVASKYPDCDDLWWRMLEVEGSGFIRLFKGTVKKACT